MKGKWRNTLISFIQTYLIYHFFDLSGLFLWFICLAAAIYFQDSIFYIPTVPKWLIKPLDNPTLLRNPMEMGLSVEDVHVTTEDGVYLDGWLVRKDDSKRIIVYYNGNMAQKWWRIGLFKLFKEQTDSDVLVVPYRGFSGNEGKPSVQGFKKDGEAAMEYAIKYREKEKSEGRSKDIYAYGRSLGGAVAIYLAANTRYKYELKGIMLENTFSNFKDLLMDKALYIYPFLWFLKTHWISNEIINEVEVPIMFIRSLKDYFILPYHMLQLIKRATKSRLCMEYQVDDGKHMAVWYINPQLYASKVNNFFYEVENCQEVRP